MFLLSQHLLLEHLLSQQSITLIYATFAKAIFQNQVLTLPVVDSAAAVEQLELLKTQATIMRLGKGGINQHDALLRQRVFQKQVLKKEKHCSGYV